jgi:hypothetical protein
MIIERRDMNDDQLKRSLQSIGMGCFVKHFAMFCNKQISNNSAVDVLMAVEKYSESGSRTRVSQSRRIITEGRTKDALRLISKADRVDPEWKKQAIILLNANP